MYLKSEQNETYQPYVEKPRSRSPQDLYQLFRRAIQMLAWSPNYVYLCIYVE